MPRHSASGGGPGLRKNQINRTSTRLAKMQFFYVYILENVTKEKFYVGFTEDLQARLKTHNSGSVPHTAKHRP